jgi:hypothetical protein
MGMRTLAQLRRDQSELREALAAESRTDAIAAEPSPESPGSATWLVRVAEIVTDDPTLGAHLKVVRQKLSGTPPVATDADAFERVAYPRTGQDVAAFAVGEFVWLHRVSGMLIAEPQNLLTQPVQL